MKPKIITAVLLCGLIAGFSLDLYAKVGVPHGKNGEAVLCSYNNRDYTNWGEAFCGPDGGDMEFVKFCYDDAISRGYVIDKDFVDAAGYPTASAAICGQLEGLKFFLDKGFYLDEVNRWSRLTPLQSAAKQGHYQVCKYLLEQGASPIKKSYNGKMDAFDFALASGRQKVIGLIGEAWRKWKGISNIKRRAYIEDINKLDMNDYEKFKLEHNLSVLGAEAFSS